jgi:hypothetical protein
MAEVIAFADEAGLDEHLQELGDWAATILRAEARSPESVLAGASHACARRRSSFVLGRILGQPDDLSGDQNDVMPIDRSMVDEQLLRLSPDEGLDLLRIEGDRRGTLKIETRCTFLV